MATAGTNWRLANSLIKLREQINAAHPNRSRASDGTIGDTAHAATVSDHNPNANNVVTAFDITHDPRNGMDVQKLADSIAESRDARIKYMIFNDRIMVPTDFGWTWRFHYAGSHRSHLHVSVWGDYDNTTNWNIGDDMPELINLDTARILAAAAGTRDGFDGRPDAHGGVEDADLIRNHVGKELTNQYVRDKWFVSLEASNRFGINRQVYKERDALHAQVAALKSELETATQKLAQISPTLPSSVTPESGTPGEPIDGQKVNWLVRILINLFNKKA